jgi:uncharacterized protein (DUF1499 family)
MRARRLATVLFCTLVVLGGAGLVVRLWLSRTAELQLTPAEIVDFAKLRPSTQTNRYVMCPAALCPDSANAPSPTFAMRWERLRDYWNEAVALQPRVELVLQEAGGRRLTYIQRSLVFRFPDIITVEFLTIEGGRSTLAVASHSRYGREDFGVNAKRVEAWVDLLVSMMRKDQVSL